MQKLAEHLSVLYVHDGVISFELQGSYFIGCCVRYCSFGVAFSSFFGHRTNHSSAELSKRQIYTELLSKRPWQTGGSDCTAQRVSLCL